MIVVNTDNKPVFEEGDNVRQKRAKIGEVLFNDKAPLVSVIVLGWNRSDKTRICVESVLKFTEGIDYELVLLDNGSTDDTLDYFQSVDHPKKTIIRITKNVGAFFGMDTGMLHSSGKYLAELANDTYVTKNWLKNMLRCAESDPCIGMISPRSSNVSNLQNANISFLGLEEMRQKTAEYNVSDPRKWHERLRLITIATLFRRECLSIIGRFDYGFVHDFGDDDITFRVRRAGYKAILCGDVFVHHDHPMEERNEAKFTEDLKKGKLDFREKYHGVDAWDDVNNFEPGIMALVNPEEKRGLPSILGIDVRCGTPILELKNRLRLADVFNAHLAAFTTEAKYYPDLLTICDEGRVFVDRPEYLKLRFQAPEFDYVVLGKPINTYRQSATLISDIKSLLKPDGKLLVTMEGNGADVIHGLASPSGIDLKSVITLP